MEKTLNQSVERFSATGSHIAGTRVAAGDFVNSSHLEKQLSMAIRALNQTSNPQLPETLRQPQAQMNDALSGAEKMTTGQMPQKTVLFEACCINQPLNSSLRDQYSIGTYYFLK